MSCIFNANLEIFRQVVYCSKKIDILTYKSTIVSGSIPEGRNPAWGILYSDLFLAAFLAQSAERSPFKLRVVSEWPRVRAPQKAYSM